MCTQVEALELATPIRDLGPQHDFTSPKVARPPMRPDGGGDGPGVLVAADDPADVLANVVDERGVFTQHYG